MLGTHIAINICSVFLIRK